MGAARPRALVLDAGALVAFERGDGRVRALVAEAVARKVRLVVPAGVVAQVWRDGARQARLAALLRGPTTDVEPLDHALAEAAGVLCGRTATRDVVDASVVLVARRAEAPIVTSDVDDLAKLDPSANLVRV